MKSTSVAGTTRPTTSSFDQAAGSVDTKILNAKHAVGLADQRIGEVNTQDAETVDKALAAVTWAFETLQQLRDEGEHDAPALDTQESNLHALANTLLHKIGPEGGRQVAQRHAILNLQVLKGDIGAAQESFGILLTLKECDHDAAWKALRLLEGKVGTLEYVHLLCEFGSTEAVQMASDRLWTHLQESLAKGVPVPVDQAVTDIVRACLKLGSGVAAQSALAAFNCAVDWSAVLQPCKPASSVEAMHLLAALGWVVPPDVADQFAQSMQPPPQGVPRRHVAQSLLPHVASVAALWHSPRYSSQPLPDEAILQEWDRILVPLAKALTSEQLKPLEATAIPRREQWDLSWRSMVRQLCVDGPPEAGRPVPALAPRVRANFRGKEELEEFLSLMQAEARDVDRLCAELPRLMKCPAVHSALRRGDTVGHDFRGAMKTIAAERGGDFAVSFCMHLHQVLNRYSVIDLELRQLLPKQLQRSPEVLRIVVGEIARDPQGQWKVGPDLSTDGVLDALKAFLVENTNSPDAALFRKNIALWIAHAAKHGDLLETIGIVSWAAHLCAQDPPSEATFALQPLIASVASRTFL